MKQGQEASFMHACFVGIVLVSAWWMVSGGENNVRHAMTFSSFFQGMNKDEPARSGNCLGAWSLGASCRFLVLTLRCQLLLLIT
eukprot:662975-Pelagomonas_calceolata.AAC.2